jgi:hypothetical protein
MYTPAEMCCEICSRISTDCIYWSTPPIHIVDPFTGNNGCELFMSDPLSEWLPESMFINNTSTSATVSMTEHHHQHRRHLLVDHYHGPPKGHRPVYFVGCGWSFWMTLDYPCLNGDLDDRIPIMNNQSSFSAIAIERTDPDSENFVLSPTVSRYMPNYDDDTTLPLCTLNTEQPNQHSGRWVRGRWPNTSVCPHEMEIDTESGGGMFKIMKYDPDRPQCWHRDDLSTVGHSCKEMNCQFISEESKWTTSSLHLEKQFYGTYKQYSCQYKHYTDQELQTCINERKIYKIDGSGASIWLFLQQYLNQRIKKLTMYQNENESDGLQIHLSTLALLHHNVRTLHDELDKLTVVNTSQLESYWVNSLYVSSEREHEARGPIQIVKSQIAQDTLGWRGYSMLNLYDMTAAFTFDTATQMDGMHIIGPPMKMLITKLFHYMCLNTTVSLT